jgi:hypothetical protein
MVARLNAVSRSWRSMVALLLAELGHHCANRLAQFLRAERLELGLVDHGE